jgi:hypothetical protein
MPSTSFLILLVNILFNFTLSKGATWNIFAEASKYPVNKRIVLSIRIDYDAFCAIFVTSSYSE